MAESLRVAKNLLIAAVAGATLWVLLDQIAAELGRAPAWGLAGLLLGAIAVLLVIRLGAPARRG